jgi:hypothetical protein
MTQINAAYEVLSDPYRRASYDAQLHMINQAPGAPQSPTNSSAPTSHTPAYMIHLTNRAAQQIIDVIFVASLCILILALFLQSPESWMNKGADTSGQAIILLILVVSLFSIRRSPNISGLALALAFGFIAVGAIIWIPILSSVNQLSAFGQSKIAIMVGIWVVASVTVAAIAVKQFKVT